jgi:hypothetical protein
VKDELGAHGVAGHAPARSHGEGASKRRQVGITAPAGLHLDRIKGQSVAVLPFVNMTANQDDEYFVTAWRKSCSTRSPRLTR